MVWDLLRTKKEKPAAGKTGYWRTFWRRRWDSNPRTLADQTISSRSRYDHFDTSPYLSQHQHLRKRGELMGRTSKNIKLRTPEKPQKIKGFRSGSYRVATTISSQPRYDHFDTSPCMFQSAFIFAQISLRKLLERKAGEKTGKYSIFHFEIPYISRIPGKQNCQAGIYSESRLFWPLRYCSEASILYNTEIRFASTKFRLNNIIERHAGLSPMSIPMPIPIPALKCVYPIRQASSPH